MGTEVANFGMDDLKKKVAEEAQARFGALIPPETFQKMIDAAIKEFFETPVSFSFTTERGNGGYGSSHDNKFITPISPFKAIVWSFLHKESMKILQEYFSEKENAARQTIINALKEDKPLSDSIDLRAAQLAGIFATSQSLSLQQAAMKHLLSMLLQHASTTGDHSLYNDVNRNFNPDGSMKI